MKKKHFLIFVLLCIIGYISFCIYNGIFEQKRIDEKIICNCKKTSINKVLTLSSDNLNPNTTKIFFDGKKILFNQNLKSTRFLVDLDIEIKSSSKDTLYIKDHKSTIKIYDFVVDTLIINKKRGIQCDLKQLSIDGKKQCAGDVIIID